MKLKKGYRYLFLLALPFLQGTQCNKDVPDHTDNYEHNFTETVSLSPYQPDYHVGDTIWLRVSIPGKKLLDENTGTRVFFDSALFKNQVEAQLLFSDPFIGDGPFVQYLFPSGVSAFTNNYSYQTQGFVDFGCAPSLDYTLRLGLVLLKKGAIGIRFNNGSIMQCGTNNYKNSKLIFTFDVPDTHEEFYRQLPFASIGKTPDDTVLYALAHKWMVVINVQ